ncbi:hypothetical protein PAXRUDRAFT_21228 [Paxillus rubicundulus Ve08.2h10]|uniref:Uncharacterized protein n=1 Tax=Paxillus rubicundulus Ve08.2h10 TaxID=930991 RepID=A0A0D0D7U5_9AGAM|nr:hypothetical protein PAXRUDRAFT_21228 [Paxillus rubicundulus Ve08.2h10]
MTEESKVTGCLTVGQGGGGAIGIWWADVIFHAAQVNSASPEPTPDQVHFLCPPFLRSSAFLPSP